MRKDNRSQFDLRSINIEIDNNCYAEGSCLISQGQTKVLCNATIEDKVPSFIKDKSNNSGWLTAEYSMLPRSTHTRINRERQKINARSSEIQRLIGRSLRAMVELTKIGERTITVDCDVLQADGGTRCAAINGGAVAVAIALNKFHQQKKIQYNPIKSLIAAVSVVNINNHILVDPNFLEDSNCDIDLNLVVNQNDCLIELQASCEGQAPDFEVVDQMIGAGRDAIRQIIDLIKSSIKNST